MMQCEMFVEPHRYAIFGDWRSKDRSSRNRSYCQNCIHIALFFSRSIHGIHWSFICHLCALNKSSKKRKRITVTLLLLYELHHRCHMTITRGAAREEVPLERTFTQRAFFSLSSPLAHILVPECFADEFAWIGESALDRRPRCDPFTKCGERNWVKASCVEKHIPREDGDYRTRYRSYRSLSRSESTNCAFHRHVISRISNFNAIP